MDMRKPVYAKEYLESVGVQKIICNQIAQDLQEAMIDAYGLSGVAITEKVQTSSSPDWRIDAAIQEVDRLRAEYENAMNKYVLIKKDVRCTIRGMPDKMQARVLELKYCKGMRLCDIAEDLGKKDGYVRRIHGEALESFRCMTNLK